MKILFRLVQLYLLIAAAMLATGCSQSARERIDIAESVVNYRPDSAYILLNRLNIDGLPEEYRARFILTKALADMGTSHQLVTDSLLPEAINFYLTQGDTLAWLKSNLLYVAYLYRLGDLQNATAVIDEALTSIPADSIDYQYQLRETRARMSVLLENYPKAMDDTEWLLYHTRFDQTKHRMAQLKMFLLYIQGEKQEAVKWGEEAINSDYFPEKDTFEWCDFMGDFAEILDEAGHSSRAIAIVEDIVERNPLHFNNNEKAAELASLAKYYANSGNLRKARELLTEIEGMGIDPNQFDSDIRNELTFLSNAINFKESGHLSLMPMKKIVHELNQQRRISSSAMDAMNDLSAQRMQLVMEKQRLWLIILVVSLILIVTASAGFWILRRRRRRIFEAEERIDTLSEMLRQVRESDKDDKNAMLKRLVLLQMGVLKTFASAPTAQNRDALRKISSIGGDPAAAENLVDWKNLYAMVDELFDRFHSRLTERFPDLFTPKEIQILCLMRAGFSTKEISFLTEQSSATIYVRKTAIRKKLHTPENGDIIASVEAAFAAATPD